MSAQVAPRAQFAPRPPRQSRRSAGLSALATLSALAALSAVAGCSSAPLAPPRTQAGSSAVSPAEAEDLDPAPAVFEAALTAAPLTREVAGHEVQGYAYNGQVPGPTLRVQLGDTVRVHLDNQLDAPTTIHWHGLAVPWEMDGVAWMGAPVAAGDSFTYEFVAESAGTFWYHPHFDTDRQVDLGLYGVLIVEDPADPPTDEELVLVFDQQAEHDGYQENLAHGHGLFSPWGDWLVNDQHTPSLPLRGGATVRLRLLNAANAGYLALGPSPLDWIGGDQGLLASSRPAEELLLPPGARADLSLRVGEEGFLLEDRPWSLNGGAVPWATPQVLFEIAVEEPAPAPAEPAWPHPDAPPTPDPGWTDITYVFSGDGAADTWLINGERFPDVTIETAPLGSQRVIEVRNASPTHHPFHLHGMHFEVLSIDGVPPAERLLADTIDVAIRQRVRLLIEADNPGDWMAHCHILPHADGGMMTVLRVE